MKPEARFPARGAGLIATKVKMSDNVRPRTAPVLAEQRSPATPQGAGRSGLGLLLSILGHGAAIGAVALSSWALQAPVMLPIAATEVSILALAEFEAMQGIGRLPEPAPKIDAALSPTKTEPNLLAPPDATAMPEPDRPVDVEQPFAPEPVAPVSPPAEAPDLSNVATAEPDPIQPRPALAAPPRSAERPDQPLHVTPSALAATLDATLRPSPRPSRKPAQSPESVADASTEPAPAAQSSPAPQAASSASAQSGQSAPEVAGSSDREVASWGAAIRARIDRRKSYPRAARGASGTVTLRLSVTQAGALADLAITGSSGNAALDAAAVATAQSASLPKAPAGLTEAIYTFALPVTFTR